MLYLKHGASKNISMHIDLHRRTIGHCAKRLAAVLHTSCPSHVYRNAQIRGRIHTHGVKKTTFVFCFETNILKFKNQKKTCSRRTCPRQVLDSWKAAGQVWQAPTSELLIYFVTLWVQSPPFCRTATEVCIISSG